MNKCIFVGRVAGDPEMRQTQNGISVCSFPLAVERPKIKGKEQGADFLRMIAWRARAEFAWKWLHKGDKIAVISEARTRTYEKDGQTHYVTEFHVENIEFAGGKRNQSTPQSAAPTTERNNEHDDLDDGFDDDFDNDFEDFDDYTGGYGVFDQ